MQKYIRHSKVQKDVVFPLIQKNLGAKWGKETINGEFVNVVSLRLRTFLIKGVVCAGCGCEATHFALERSSTSLDTEMFHLNLYGIGADGIEILFTHDHILAKSLGGKDNISNTQTMCYECNQEKGKIEQTMKKVMPK